MSETATLPPPNVTDEELQNQMQIQIVDVSQGVRANAVDAADSYISDQSSEGGVKGFVKRIWHGNIARDYIRQREIRHGRQVITETGNLYALDGADQDEHNTAMSATVERFTDGFLHSGEENGSLAEINNGDDISNQLQNLVREYASGAIDLPVLQDERTRLLDTLGTTLQTQDKDKGLLLADNVLEVAVNARTAFEHGVGIDKIDQALGVKAGEARMGVRTELHRDVAERVLDKIQGTRIGSLLNETTVSAAVGIGFSIGKFTARKASMALVATLGLGVGAGVLGGLRERLRVKQERQLHGREMAEGGEISDHAQDKRRVAMEATRYETVSASALIADLRSSGEALGHGADATTLSQSIANLSHARTRIKLSDEQNADYISFDGKTEVEQQRLELDILVAELEVQLQTAIDSADDTTLDHAGITSRNADDTIDIMSDWTADIMSNDGSDRDAVFNKLRRNRSLKMGAIAFVSGVTIGVALQEVRAAFSDDFQGIFEHSSDSQDRRSLLAGLLKGHSTTLNETITDHLKPETINDQTSVALPPGYQLEESDGTYQLLSTDGKVVIDQVSFDDKGHFDTNTQALLAEKGWTLRDASETFQTSRTEVTEVQRAPGDYINAHPDQFTGVDRQLWYNNDTPQFDRNELRVWWGADGNTGINSNGDYVFNASNMTADGSFHGDQSVNFQDLINSGQLKMAISLDRDSQHYVQMFTFDQDGNAIIDKNSIVGKHAFTMIDGRAHFTGGFAEAVQVMGINDVGDTSVRMLATLEGDNQPQVITDNISQVITENQERIISTLDAPVIADQLLPTEIAPVIPIYGRKGLENLAQPEENNSQTHYDYGYSSPEQRHAMEADLSPRLAANPDAILNPREELDAYREALGRRRGQAYLDVIDQHIESSPELQSVGVETKAIVCIPVAAKSEAENIYNTLSLYAQQEGGVQASTKILLHVNWIDDQMQDDASRTAIEKTEAEIERARADFPDLKIAVMRTEWERSFVDSENGGKRKGDIIGEVARRLYDTALMTTQKSIASGNHDSDDDVLIIRNDSDAQGMSHSYLRNMIGAFETEPATDGFTGLVRWDTGRHKEFPGFGVVTNFREVMHAVTGLRSSKVRVPTIGINVAIRASTFAAVGGVGTGEYIGAGSDDLEIGSRLYHARNRSNSYEARRPVRALYGSPSLLSRITGQRTPVTSAYSASDEPANASAIKVVGGAAIDSAGDRILNIYRQERPITETWTGFSSRSRSEVDSNLIEFDGENPLTDMAKITERVERNISEMAHQWFSDPAHLRLGLRFMFPETDDSGQPIYELKTTRRGGSTFVLTDAGRVWLQNRIIRDGLGRYDPFGSRVRRNLYSETRDGARKQSVSTRPRFVKAVA